MSSPASIAFRAASFRSSAKPCFIISVTEPQSETTTPSNFHSLRRIPFNSFLFPVAGIPSLSLNEVIILEQLAFIAFSKGGR